MTGDSTFGDVAANVTPVVQSTVEDVIWVVMGDYGDSYPASLFKNLAKCKALATKVEEL
jgi:hypothetical protein